jgi:glycosyltransferase 2 family protein
MTENAESTPHSSDQRSRALSAKAVVTPARAGKVLLSLVLGGVLVYALHQGGVPLVPARDAFAQVRWWTLPIYLVLLATTSYFRAVRWRLLLRPLAPVSAGQALSAVLIGSGAILLLPFRLGEMARPYWIARDKRVPLLGALATVVVERILDGLALALILAASLLFVPTLAPLSTRIAGLPLTIGAVRGYAWTFLLTFVLAFAAIVAFHSARDWGVRITHAVFGRISPRLGQFVAARLDSFGSGLDFFKHRALAARFSIETFLYWGSGALSYWVLAWGVGVVHADGTVMSLGEACAVMGVLGIATVLPGPPGLIGLFQTGAYAAMTMYFPAEVVTGAGSAYVFLLYVLQMGMAGVAAVVCLLVAAFSARPNDEATAPVGNG